MEVQLIYSLLFYQFLVCIKMIQFSISVCVYIITCVCVCAAAQSCLTVSPWTVACQTPLSVGFSRQEYWSRLPCLLPGDLPDPGDQTCSSCIGRQVLYHQCHLKPDPPPLRGLQSSRSLSILSLYIGHIPTFKSADKWSKEKQNWCRPIMVHLLKRGGSSPFLNTSRRESKMGGETIEQAVSCICRK